MISHHGIIIMHHRGTGSGKRMTILVLDKASFHTLRGTLTDIQVAQRDALDGIKMFREALQIGITMGILEVLGIQIGGDEERQIGITVLGREILLGTQKEQVIFLVGILSVMEETGNLVLMVQMAGIVETQEIHIR